jgi:hypothetical protein
MHGLNDMYYFHTAVSYNRRTWHVLKIAAPISERKFEAAGRRVRTG